MTAIAHMQGRIAPGLYPNEFGSSFVGTRFLWWLHVDFEWFFYSGLPEFKVHYSWFCFRYYENVYVT